VLKSIAFHILKGGCGKSSFSGNISFNLSKSKKTILIDCDIQANSSSWFLTEFPKYELANVLQGSIELNKAIIKITDNFFILPTKRKDSELKVYAETKLFQEPFIFEDLNQELNKLGFEFAIYDLSPSISQLERCILLAMNEVITPISPEFFGFDGIELFYSELQKINKSYRKNIKHNKIILNLINESFATHNQYLEAIKTMKNYNLFFVKQDRNMADSQKNHKTIFEYSPKSKIIPELNRLTESIIGD